MVPQNGKIRMQSKGWIFGLILILTFQIWFFSRTITEPWTDHADFNGAAWSQAAHNFLQGGIWVSAGVPAPFHFGPLPIPSRNYYGHHPNLLALMITGAFRFFGEHEWSARLVPILCSIVSTVLLWLIVKSCGGIEIATYSAAIFTALPMELRWGQMVNFEPCALMWMLVGFLGLRYWELTNERVWKAVMLFGFTFSMMTAWLGYFLVGFLCIHFIFFDRKKRFGIAWSLLAIAVILGCLFLVQIFIAKPDAISDLTRSFSMRFGQNIGTRHFTFQDWTVRIQTSLGKQVPLPFALLALLGISHMVRNKTSADWPWLGWLCCCVGGMNILYIVAFRNASFIHDYASFYLVIPAAILAGIGVHLVSCWVAATRKSPPPLISAGLLVAMGMCGYVTTESLSTPARILDLNKSEPKALIPALGKVIESEFPEDTNVLSNFDLYFTPQFWYYSQRKLTNGMTSEAYWKDFIATHPHNVGGVIWLGAPEAEKILSTLNPKDQKRIVVEGIPFCIWKP